MTLSIVDSRLIAGLLVWLAIATFVGFLVYRASKSIRVGLLTTVTLFVFPIWDLIPGLMMYSKYVKELAGVHVFKTVEADGYLETRSVDLDSVVSTLLVARNEPKGVEEFPYSYYEGWFVVIRQTDLIQKAGYYEIRLAEGGRPECATFDAWPGSVGFRRARHLEGLCVLAIRRDEPRSRYQLDRQNIRKALPGPKWLPPVMATWQRIIDRRSGEILAQSYQLRYESWFPMPQLDDYRPLSWFTSGQGWLVVTDVVRPSTNIGE